MNKLLLCLFLAGCSAGIQPSLDFGPAADAASDAAVSPDGGLELDAGDDLGPDLAVDPDAGAPPDAAPDPDLGPPPVDAAPDPDAGPAPCALAVVVELCADARCCNRSCDPDGTCAHGFAVSGSFCTCDNVMCGDSECAFGGMTCCL